MGQVIASRFSGALPSLITASGAGDVPAEERNAAWYVKLGAKILAIIGGLGAVIVGVITLISFSLSCIIAGILMILSGIFVLIIEMQTFCSAFSVFAVIIKMAEKITYLPKAIIYIAAAILPLCLCFSISAVITGLLLIGAALLNVYMMVGQKWCGRADSNKNNAASAASQAEQGVHFSNVQSQQQPQQQQKSGITIPLNLKF
ncbi:hypothetical protein HELRODRAFT_193312 [Helobdella robusta]|uniref:Calcium channel flower n=1 Tax=Helobdella robusta TaxID=6412 RepID=T1FUV3_HELRO|nr:hypothetical protein HELRODRAFT_193312 [Helobdella robusta]ESN97230.1 hypothetical protein HELRODRAFT_193312 [Helobdella robusta]